TSDVSYSLQSVVADGANLVDAGRQRFRPAQSPVVTFTVQFHTLTVRAHDALFGDPLGVRAKVTGPDGAVHVLSMRPDHRATLDHLPRGHYRVDGTAGWAIVLTD